MAHVKRKARHTKKAKVHRKHNVSAKKQAAPRVSFSTANRDALLRKLKQDYKRDMAEILETAARRRKRAKPKQLQTILIWEMDRIRHADAKYRVMIDTLNKSTPDSNEEQRKNAPLFTEGKTDKRPSPKESKLAD